MNKKITIMYLIVFIIGILLIFANGIIIANYIELDFNFEKTQLMVENFNRIFYTIGITFIVVGSLGYFLEKYKY